MALDFGKISKLMALAGSDQPGEAQSAIAKIGKLLAAEGKSFTDLAEMVKKGSPAAPQEAQGFRVVDPADFFGETFAADIARGRAESRAKKAALRESLIQRHGSAKTAIAPCERESLMLAAVKPWRRVCERPRQRWTRAIGDCDSWISRWEEKAPAAALSAIAKAYPMPETIPAAKAEYDYWSQRNAELDAFAEGPFGDIGLDLVAYIRWEMVRIAFEVDIVSRSLSDLLIRTRYYDAQESHNEDGLKAIWRDVEILEELGRIEAKIATVMSEARPSNMDGVPARHTATERRQAVLELLSNPDTSALPDREIARRVGVTPTTVGNVRRRMAAAA